MSADTLGLTLLYLVALPLGAVPLVWIAARVSEPVAGWLTTIVLALDAILVLSALATAGSAPPLVTLEALTGPAGAIDVAMALTPARVVALLVVTAGGTILATFSWQVIAPERAFGFYGPLLLGAAALQGAILSVHPLTTLACLGLADLALAIAVGVDLTDESGRAATRLLVGSQAPILLVAVTWWMLSGSIGANPVAASTHDWSFLIGAPHWAIVGVAVFWALRAGLVPFHVWLTPALDQAIGARAGWLTLASIGVGGLLLIEHAGRAVDTPWWPAWRGGLLTLGVLGLVVSTVRSMAPTSVHRAAIYLAVSQASLLALVIGLLPTAVDLARAYHVVVLIALALVFLASAAIQLTVGDDAPGAIGRAAGAEPIAAAGAIVGLLLVGGGPPALTFDLRLRLVETLIGGAVAIVPAVAIGVAIAANLAAGLLVPLRLMRGGPDPIAVAPALPWSARATILALGIAILGLTLIDQVNNAADLFGPDLGLRLSVYGALLVAALLGVGLFAVESDLIGGGSIGAGLRGAVRALGERATPIQDAADRGMFDPATMLQTSIGGLARVVAFVVERVPGRFGRPAEG